MSKKVLISLSATALLLVGVLAGVIFGDNLRALAAGGAPSATPNTGARGDYCQLYLQTLASDLGTTPDKLKSANQDAAQKVIDQMARDGKISADQKARLTQRLQKYANSPCAFITARGHDSPRNRLKQTLAPARAAVESAVAGALKLSPATLESDLKAGQTIPQIATAQKVAIGDVNTAYLNAIKSQLSSAVSAGKLTQSQSDMLFSRVQQAVQAGHYPLLGAGAMGGHQGA